MGVLYLDGGQNLQNIFDFLSSNGQITASITAS
jgi:hypothetical protein